MTDTMARQPTPAEESKLLAEAEAARATAKAKLAEAAEHDALARKAMVETEIQEINMRTIKIAADQAERKEKEELATDKHHHVYTFSKSVGADSVTSCILQLTQWMRNDPGCEIEIVFNSPGGSVIEGMALYDFIQMLKSKGHPVITAAIGMAASMAGILLQAGDKRVMGKESYLLIHEISFGAGGKIGEVEDEIEFIKKIQKRVIKIFASRSNLTETQIARRWSRKDWWMSSEEALKAGFIDEVR